MFTAEEGGPRDVAGSPLPQLSSAPHHRHNHLPPFFLPPSGPKPGIIASRTKRRNLSRGSSSLSDDFHQVSALKRAPTLIIIVHSLRSNLCSGP